MLPEIAGATEASIAKTLRQSLEKDAFSILNRPSLPLVLAIWPKDPEGKEFSVWLVGVDVGWSRANLEGLGLEGAGIDTNGRHIVIDDQYATNVPNIYAAGDVTAKVLAHTASRQVK